MPKFYNSPSGVRDVLPDDHDFFTFIKKVVRHRFRQSGFRRISPALFEDRGVFERAYGENSGLLSDLYDFEDRQGRSLALRSDIITGVVRSFIQHEMDQGPLPVELYFIERCFRQQKISQRNQREFWQFGSMILGEKDPSVDAQVIYLAHRILSDLRIREHVTLKVSTVGSAEDRKAYSDALANFYLGKERSLSLESREKLQQKRYFDLLSPTNEDEAILLEMAPKITDFLSPESKQFFEDVLMYLDTFDIEYKIDNTIPRSVDNASHTIFEFDEGASGTKLVSGSRSDELIQKMGGGNYGSVGFAAGVERLIAFMKKNDLDVPHKDELQIFVAATGPKAKKYALPILVDLREHGFHAVGVLGKTSMNEQLKRAERFNVPYAVIMGDIEVKKDMVLVRDMKSGTSKPMKIDKLIPYLDAQLGAPAVLDTTKDFLGHN